MCPNQIDMASIEAKPYILILLHRLINSNIWSSISFVVCIIIIISIPCILCSSNNTFLIKKIMSNPMSLNIVVEVLKSSQGMVQGEMVHVLQQQQLSHMQGLEGHLKGKGLKTNRSLGIGSGLVRRSNLSNSNILLVTRGGNLVKNSSSVARDVTISLEVPQVQYLPKGL